MGLRYGRFLLQLDSTDVKGGLRFHRNMMRLGLDPGEPGADRPAPPEEQQQEEPINVY